MKELTQKIPLITAVLLTAGFVNSYSFYSHFGIEIYTFQTSGELILSFLPVMIPLIVAIIFLLIFTLQKSDQSEKAIKEDQFLADKDLSFWGPFKELKILIKGRFRSNDKIGETILHYFMQILSRIVLLIFLLFPTYYNIVSFINRQGEPYTAPTSFLSISIIWLIIISFRINNYFNKKNKELSKSIMPYIVFIGFLVIIYIFNSFKAFRILENKPFYSIELNLKDKTIKSDDNLIFIGKTKEYYFLRELKSEKNLIINSKDVDLVYFKVINKSNK